MSFDFEIAADPSRANRAIDGVQRGLRDVEQHAKRAGSAMDGAFQDKSGRWRTATGQFLLMGQTGARAGQQIGNAMDTASRKAVVAAKSIDAVGSSLSRIAVLVGAAFSVRTLVTWADGYTQISNRLNTIAKDQDNLNGLMTASHTIAQNTFQDWGTTAEAVVRFKNATAELGTSQKDVLQFTERLNKAVALSGATTSEATNGIIQMSQGLASGALRGDEFRSVTENLTFVADMLAKGLGKTRGELKKMAGEGKLTAEQVMKAFQKVGPEIEQRFGKVIPTIGQSLTMMKNEAIKFFGAAGTGSGLLRGLSDVFKILIKNFDTIGKVIMGVAQALLLLYVIEKIIVLIRVLTVAIMANPLGALLVGITVGIALLRQFGDQIDTQILVWNNVKGVYVSVGDILRVLWTDVKALASAIADFISGAWTSLTDAFSDGLDSTEIELSLENVLILIASFVDASIAAFKAFKTTLIIIFGGIPVVIGEMFVDLARGIVRVIQELINGVLKAYNAVRGALFDTANNTAGRRLAATNAAMGDINASRGADSAQTARLANEKFPIVASASGAGARIGDKFDPKAAAAAQLRADAAVRAREQAVAAFIAERSALDANAKIKRRMEEVGLDEQGNDPRSGKIGLVDLDFENPLAGAAGKANEMFKKAYGEDFGSEVGRDFVKGYIQSVKERALLVAADRINAKKKDGTISDEKGKKGKDPLSKAEESALKKMKRELDEVTASSNPMTDAQMKLAKAVDVTSRAMKVLNLPLAEADKIVSDTAKKTADAREPMLAWVRQMEQENRVLLMTNGERERANQIRQAEHDLREKGLDVDAKTQAVVAKEIDIQRGREAMIAANTKRQTDLHEAMTKIRAPLNDYNHAMDIHKQLLSDGAITTAEYEKAVRLVKHAFLEATGGQMSFDDSIIEGLKAVRNEATDAAAAIKTALVNAFHGVENAIVELVTKGQTDWRQMINAMLGDLTRLMMRQGFAAMRSAFGPQLPGHAGGTSFRVGGQGGTDSQVVAFRASPNENVTVSNPASVLQAEREGRGMGGSGASFKIVNQWDPNQGLAAMDSPSGERLIMNAVMRNMDTLRAHLSRK